MPRARHITLQALLLGALAVQSAAAPLPATTEIASIDLSRPFGTRSAWQFTATQAPPIPDPFGPDDGTVPGAVTLCLHKGAEGPCDPQLQAKLFDTSDVPAFSERHYLEAARIVRSHGASGQPLLLIVSASLHSGDGDQLVPTQVMAYQRGQDRFTRVYERWTGTNNNQDLRFVETGPLAGDIIAAEPSETAPYGYWVSVYADMPGRPYRQVLRYRSATLYADGNALPVIDSEMANIQRRLGLWRPGLPLPLPATPCAKPHLRGMALWCE